MGKKISAVEWLYGKWSEQGTLYFSDLNQAKAMEKEQSECICVNVIEMILDESEQGKEINSKEIFEKYYKETFKSE